MCRHSATFGSIVASSDQPVATTEHRRADVRESPVAKSVTSWPAGDEPFGQQRGEELPRPVVARRARHEIGASTAIRTAPSALQRRTTLLLRTLGLALLLKRPAGLLACGLLR